MGPEKKIQTAVIGYLKKSIAEHTEVAGLYRKIQGGKFGTNGWLDYEIFLKRGEDTVVLMIEFKAPGKVPTPLQALRIRQLEAVGVVCNVCDNIEEGKRLIDAAMRFYL